MNAPDFLAGAKIDPRVATAVRLLQIASVLGELSDPHLYLPLQSDHRSAVQELSSSAYVLAWKIIRAAVGTPE